MIKRVVVAYIPVLHAGYLRLMHETKPDEIYVISEEVLSLLPDSLEYLRRKDVIRAIPARMIAEALAVLMPKVSVLCVGPKDLRSLARRDDCIIMPHEDVSRAVTEMFFGHRDVELQSIFLRWDYGKTVAEEEAGAIADFSVSYKELDRTMMRRALNVSGHSGDWWRRVGAVLVKENNVLFAACNQHVPDPQLPYALGDPRSLFKRGVRIDLSTAEHAEAEIIASAAREGIATEGASLYVTTFPCPPCAKLIARAGIKRCYFSGGYSRLDGADVLRGAGVELVLVK